MLSELQMNLRVTRLKKERSEGDDFRKLGISNVLGIG